MHRERREKSTKHFDRGMERYRAGQFGKAVAEFTKALKLRPDPAARLQRGMAYARSEQLGEAISDFRRVLETPASEQTRGDTCYNLGLAYEKRGERAEAVRWYGQAIEHNPNLANAYCNRGAQLLELGCCEEAVSDLDMALTLSPHDFMAYWNRAQAHGRLGDVEQHWDDLEAFVRYAPPEHPLRPKVAALFR